MHVDPDKVTLHQVTVYGEESQDEMEVIPRRNGDESTEVRGEDYAYGLEYQNAVTPNGTYTIYAPDSTYAQYYPYQNNMQSSPQDNGAYQVLAAPQSPVSMDDQDGIQQPNAQRASPATVNWLFDNYEIAEGSSLPRCQLYDHYRKHCAEHRMDPVNAASFGKLIRSVFQNLKTRRLGTRGNSKYHYYGIRMKEGSTLGQIAPQENLLIQDNTYIPPMQQLVQQRDAYADTVNQVAGVKVYLDGEIPQKRMKKEQHHSSSSCSSRDSISPPLDIIPNQQVLVHQTSVDGVLPPQPQLQINIPAYVFTESDKAALGKLDMPPVPFHNKEQLLVTINFRKLGMGIDELNKLIDCYHFMCKEVLTLVKNVQFTSVEDVWARFWLGGGGISHESLSALCTLDRVQEYIIQADLALYQTIVDCLIPNVLLSELSAGMTQSCRTFAKNIDLYLKKALQDGKMTDGFIKKKLQAIKYMQQGLKRYTSLNHLAHAARGVLMKEEQCQQMYQDYIKVDINTVHQQAGWICGCDSLMVTHVNNAFKQNLQQMSPMSVWAEWLESIVDQVLAKYHDKPAEVVSNVGKQFLLNWSFYTSMIIRDLTLRSAMSFGSFTLIRLLADDYMYYLIESKIAKAGKQQLITVIRQEKDWPLAKNNQEYIVPDSSEDQDVRHNIV
ncbi:CRE-DAF-19 protein [Caenorhabditis remanei]|uniref:CRE-DAF-19 protein n=1 Tax=Caenorhabditis remanei TaxID=31234 RepID=E3NE61_CAERE|nr:CRE-DAF-19 protein [Caenorhabditis remanei]